MLSSHEDIIITFIILNECINFIHFFNFNIFIVPIYYNKLGANFPSVTIEDKYSVVKLALSDKVLNKRLFENLLQHKYFIEINL